MLTVIKIAFLAIIGVLLAKPFQKDKSSFSFVIGIALCLFILTYVILQLGEVVDRLSDFFTGFSEYSGYLLILIKVTGITYVCEFSSGICSDAGYHAVSEQIDVLGKLSVLVAGLPILMAVVEQLKGLL